MTKQSTQVVAQTSQPTSDEIETKRASYWLEKLFYQAKSKQNADEVAQQAAQSNPTLSESSPMTDEAPLSTEEKGVQQAQKSHAGKAEENRQAVEDMVTNSNRVLLTISSVFPFDIFPTTIVLEETRLTITHKQLFASQVHSVDLKNLANVFIDTSIMFAQLTIVSDTFVKNQIVVNRLWKNEAIFMRRMIEGLRMFIEKDIDTTGYSKQELIDKLRELSTTQMEL